MKFLHDEALFALQRKALQGGGRNVVLPGERVAHRTVAWDISGNCERPVTIERRSRPDRDRAIHISTETRHQAAKHRSITMEVKCRTCPTCLAKRRTMWALRASSELVASSRTWFLTLTLNAHWQQKTLNEARMGLIEQGVDLEALTSSERFREHRRQTDKLTVLFLKRLREATQAPLRYILVCEAHKSGLPHYHALLHENGHPVTKLQIEGQWPYGFTKCKLVDTTDKRIAWYVSKYLAKSSDARVRASQDFGNGFTTLSHNEPVNRFLHSVKSITEVECEGGPDLSRAPVFATQTSDSDAGKKITELENAAVETRQSR